jgi:hypothetical protein
MQGTPQIIDGRPAMVYVACDTPSGRRLVDLMPLDMGVTRMEEDAEVLWVELDALVAVLLPACKVGLSVGGQPFNVLRPRLSVLGKAAQTLSPSSTTRPEPPRWGKSCSASHWRWSRRLGQSCSCVTTRVRCFLESSAWMICCRRSPSLFWVFHAIMGFAPLSSQQPRRVGGDTSSSSGEGTSRCVHGVRRTCGVA